MKKNNRTVIILKLTLFLIVFLSLNGCVSLTPMPFSNKNATKDYSNSTIGIMGIKISNEYKTGFQPFIKSFKIQSVDNPKAKAIFFEVKDPENCVENQYNEYVVSFELTPGKYRFEGIFGSSRSFLEVGHFNVPIYSEFTLIKNKILYLGHLEAVVVERQNDSEPRAGSILPLIDQAVAGFSGGTFKIELKDNFKKDITLLVSKHPELKGYDITKINITLSTETSQ